MFFLFLWHIVLFFSLGFFCEGGYNSRQVDRRLHYGVEAEDAERREGERR